MIVDPEADGKRAHALLRAGEAEQAARLFGQLCAEPHVTDQVYNELAGGLAQALTVLGRHRQAAYVSLYLGQHQQAIQLIASEDDSAQRARILEHAGSLPEAAELYQQAGCHVQAAIVYEKATQPARARRCWEQALGVPRLERNPYVEALIAFNLGYCCLGLDDPDAGNSHLVTAQRLLEEAADGFETAGQHERAFDCYQILLEMGRRSDTFENMAEGYLNCIRILKQDNLKFYVLQYYEDFLQEAQDRQELHAAASLYREAAEYCLRMGLLYDRSYLKSAAETWLLAAQKSRREQGPPELAENAFLAAVDCFNALGDYAGVGQSYQQLAELDLLATKQQRYASIASRYTDAIGPVEDAPPFPSYLRQPHAYPEIWYMDALEWEHDGDVGAVCCSVIGDANYPSIVRRRAVNVMLDHLSGEPDPEHLARLAERLGDLQIYLVLDPLEKLFEHSDVRVQRGVMRALRFLFFKRSFGLLNRGLASTDDGVKRAAIEALGRLYFNHAFDPLVRIFREHPDEIVRATALTSIGRIPSLEAGDFLVEVLRYEDEPLRSEARRLLASFENPEIIPTLRQHHSMESGPLRDDLGQILRQLGGSG